MNRMQFVLLMILITLGGCSTQPIIQKVSEGTSGFEGAFYQGEIHIVNKEFPISEQYRIYEKGASGFVSLSALEDDAKQRAKDFCNEQNKVMKIIQFQTSPSFFYPGNFPRIEITFVCVDRPNAVASSNYDVLYTKLNNLKKLLDNNVITKEEFEKQKAKILNQ